MSVNRPKSSNQFRFLYLFDTKVAPGGGVYRPLSFIQPPAVTPGIGIPCTLS